MDSHTDLHTYKHRLLFNSIPSRCLKPQVVLHYTSYGFSLISYNILSSSLVKRSTLRFHFGIAEFPGLLLLCFATINQ